ncbi:MAG TPA: hypothetical protein PK507_02915 [bacterium]|nr:hypothetical protein [bacterium]
MLKIDDFSKFTKTFFKIEDFSAKHIISTMNYRNDGKNKEVSSGPLYCYDITDKRVHETKKGLSINTTDSIMLANNRSLKNINNGAPNTVKTGFISIEPVNFSKVMRVLHDGEKWLCDKEYERLFTVDTQGNTIGLSNDKTGSVAKFGTGWLMIKPAVIFDNKGVGYQAIYMKTDRGILTTLTGDEYMTFVNYMSEITANFYQASLQLYNASILSIILGGIK